MFHKQVHYCISTQGESRSTTQCGHKVNAAFNNIKLLEHDATDKLQMKLYSRREHIGSADCSHECLICEALIGMKSVKPPPTPPG